METLTGKDPSRDPRGHNAARLQAGLRVTGRNARRHRGQLPESWLFGDSNAQPVHAVLTIAADRVADLRAALAQERQEASVHKVVIIFEQDGATLLGDRRGKEHFGFKDGISEPAVDGFDHPDPERPEWKKGSPGTRIIPAGEFVIGEKTVHGTVSGLPDWAKNGSFQVVRRLGQDVPGWWAQIGARLKELKNAKAVPRRPPRSGWRPAWSAAGVRGPRWRSVRTPTCPSTRKRRTTTTSASRTTWRATSPRSSPICARPTRVTGSL
ncbi:hypothetical protein NKH18_18385 [Streptomyces sp. M10(2022)]